MRVVEEVLDKKSMLFRCDGLEQKRLLGRCCDGTLCTTRAFRVNICMSHLAYMLIASNASDLIYVDRVEQSTCLRGKLNSLPSQLVHHVPTLFSINSNLRHIYSIEIYTCSTPLYNDSTSSPTQLTSKSLGQNFRHLRMCRSIRMVITTNI